MSSGVTAATQESRRVWGATVAVVARLGLAVVWAWAAIAKLGDADAALRAVRAYEILPEALVKPFAWGLPFVELALAVLLVLGFGGGRCDGARVRCVGRAASAAIAGASVAAAPPM